MIWVGYFCLALLNSLKNNLKSASYFADKAYKENNAVYRMTPWTALRLTSNKIGVIIISERAFSVFIANASSVVSSKVLVNF